MLEEVYCLNAHLLRDLKLFTVAIFKDGYFNDDTFEIRCYFNAGNENCHFDIDIFEHGVYSNDGYAEDCYLTDDYKEGCYLNDGQGVIKTPEAIRTLLLRITGIQGPATSTLGPGQNTAPTAPQRSKYNQAEET